MKRITPHSPNLNAYAERFVQTAKKECLNHFIFFGEDHFRHIVLEFERFYNRCRPHQARDNWLLDGSREPEASPLSAGDIVREEFLGGVLKHYRRAS